MIKRSLSNFFFIFFLISLFIYVHIYLFVYWEWYRDIFHLSEWVSSPPPPSSQKTIINIGESIFKTSDVMSFRLKKLETRIIIYISTKVNINKHNKYTVNSSSPSKKSMQEG